MGRVMDLTGMVFGKLTVIQRNGSDKKQQSMFLCQCSCGNQKTIQGWSLKIGDTKSCGCIKGRMSDPGKSRDGVRAPEYRAWFGMHERCNTTDEAVFRNYGSRGIKVCPEWELFERFLTDMGLKPSPKHTLDRIKNELGYSKGNCRWATRTEQNRNKRNNVTLTFQGKTCCIGEWTKIQGLGSGTINYRMKQGWDVERILTKPGHRRFL